MKFIINSPKYGKHEVEIDDEDTERVLCHKWHVDYHQKGSKALKCVSAIIKGKSVKLHKFITGYDLSDHIDGDVLNNKKKNLRNCSQRQNTWNAKLSRRNKTGYKGVWWDAKRNKYQAYIKQKDRRQFLGRFINAEDAALAYNVAAVQCRGEFARLNVVKKVV